MGSVPLSVIEWSPELACPRWNTECKSYRVDIARYVRSAGWAAHADRQYFLRFHAHDPLAPRLPGLPRTGGGHEDRNRSDRARSHWWRGANRNRRDLERWHRLGGRGRRAALSDRVLPGGRRGGSSCGVCRAALGSATATALHRVARIRLSQHLRSSSPRRAWESATRMPQRADARRAEYGALGSLGAGVAAGRRQPCNMDRVRNTRIGGAAARGGGVFPG